MSTGEQIQFNGVEKGKEHPVMNTVDENSLEWHRISTEHMDQSCFVFSLGVMDQGHDQGPALNVGVLVLVSCQVEDREDKERAKVLNVENVVPPDLFTQILQGKLVA